MAVMNLLRPSTIALVMLASAAPARADEPRDWQRLAASLRPGARIEVHLTDGHHVDGTLVARDADVLVVNPHTRIPVTPWRIGYSEIQSIDVKRAGRLSPGAKVAIGLGAGAGAVFIGLIIALAAISD